VAKQGQTTIGLSLTSTRQRRVTRGDKPLQVFNAAKNIEAAERKPITLGPIDARAGLSKHSPSVVSVTNCLQELEALFRRETHLPRELPSLQPCCRKLLWRHVSELCDITLFSFSHCTTPVVGVRAGVEA
jgi:hypothetical protein